MAISANDSTENAVANFSWITIWTRICSFSRSAVGTAGSGLFNRRHSSTSWGKVYHFSFRCTPCVPVILLSGRSKVA